jgi:hypothetical protein
MEREGVANFFKATDWGLIAQLFIAMPMRIGK